MYALSPSDSGDMPDTRLPTALLPELSGRGASVRHVADTFVDDGRNGDLLFCFYRAVESPLAEVSRLLVPQQPAGFGQAPDP